MRTLAGYLNGQWEEFSAFREIIKVLCQKDINDIEGIPVFLERLAGEEVTVGEAEEREGFLGYFSDGSSNNSNISVTSVVGEAQE